MKRYILISISTITILLFLAELTSRVFFSYIDQDKGVALYLEPDPELTWRLTKLVDGPLKTNDLGFRDHNLNDNADYKILLLGDSVSYGDRILDIKYIYPSYLEKRLKKKTGKSVEVINTAVPGYSTSQQLKYLKLKGLELKPNLIILQFCLNDIVEPYLTQANLGGDNHFLGVDTRESMHGILGFLVRNSQFVENSLRYLKRAGREQQEYQVKNLSQDKLPEELEEAWIGIIKDLEKISNLAKKHDVNFLLFATPYKYQLENPTKLRQPQNVLASLAKRKDFVFIDLLPAFYDYKKLKEVDLFLDQNHLTINGHNLTAHFLTDPIAKLLSNS